MGGYWRRKGEGEWCSGAAGVGGRWEVHKFFIFRGMQTQKRGVSTPQRMGERGSSDEVGGFGWEGWAAGTGKMGWKSVCHEGRSIYGHHFWFTPHCEEMGVPEEEEDGTGGAGGAGAAGDLSWSIRRRGRGVLGIFVFDTGWFWPILVGCWSCIWSKHALVLHERGQWDVR